MQTFYGPGGGGVGAPCVTWVLNEQGVVGDNNRDRVSPVSGERGRVSVIWPSSSEAGGHAHCRSRPRWQPVMFDWEAVTVVTSEAQSGIAYTVSGSRLRKM